MRFRLHLTLHRSESTQGWLIQNPHGLSRRFCIISPQYPRSFGLSHVSNFRYFRVGRPTRVWFLTPSMTSNEQILWTSFNKITAKCATRYIISWLLTSVWRKMWQTSWEVFGICVSKDYAKFISLCLFCTILLLTFGAVRTNLVPMWINLTGTGVLWKHLTLRKCLFAFSLQFAHSRQLLRNLHQMFCWLLCHPSAIKGCVRPL